jgi:neutral trehalase
MYDNYLHTIHVDHIIPTDLNAILLANEAVLSFFHCVAAVNFESKGQYDDALSERSVAQSYANAAIKRREAINLYLWSEELKSWADFSLLTSTHRKGR